MQTQPRCGELQISAGRRERRTPPPNVRLGQGQAILRPHGHRGALVVGRSLEKALGDLPSRM